MKLLIITQKVDGNDPILGFFIRWIAEFASHYEKVTVIGQSVGTQNLPSNVQVLSLEKEKGRSRLQQVLRFLKLQWSLRREYDAVFVHMTPIWVVIGAPLWILLRKPRYLWYEARGGGVALKIAVEFAQKVFSASVYGMPLTTPKSVVVGHGIDTQRFLPGTEPREQHLFVSVGRLSPAKRLHVLFHHYLPFSKQYTWKIAGTVITERDKVYDQQIQNMIEEHKLQEKIIIEPIANNALPVLLQQANIFLHASNTGLDKAVLEAMACGCIVLTSGKAFQDVLPNLCVADDSTFSGKLKDLLSLEPQKQESLRRELRTFVETQHSLPRLINQLVSRIEL